MAKNKTPSVPGMSGEEQALLGAQRNSLDQFNSILQGATRSATRDQGINEALAGIYNPDGTINTSALAALQQRVNAQEGVNQQLGQNANQALLNIFDQGQLGTLSDQAGVAEAQNYLNALNTQAGPTEAQKQAEAERFKKLAESAGQRGIRITGNDLFSATSESTAGNQLLSQLRKEAQLSRETQRNNDLARLQQANMQRLGFGLQRQGQTASLASGLQYDPSATALGFSRNAQAVGPQSLLGAYQNISSSYGQAAQPYTQQRYLQYQGALQNAANDAAYRGQLIGLVGQIGGAAIGGMAGGPMGAQAGSQVGGGVARAATPPQGYTSPFQTGNPLSLY